MMNDINGLVYFVFRHTEDSHVKTSLVHTLYRVKKYGVMPLEMYNELLSPAEFLKCQMHSGRRPWYSLTLEVFTAFMFRVRSKFFVFKIFNAHSINSNEINGSNYVAFGYGWIARDRCGGGCCGSIAS
jgi:hypothetical protein